MIDTLLGNEHNPPTIAKMEETYKIMREIIVNVDDSSLFQIMEGNESDIDGLFDLLSQETYATLFGYGGPGTREIDFNYIDNLNNVIEETFKIENISYFISTMIPDFELNWHHLEWGESLQRFNKMCILCSRDLGKSYYFSNAYPIWKMYRYRPYNLQDPFRRRDLSMGAKGFIMTNEMDLGRDLLEILKDTIESNEGLKERLYIGDKRDGWGKESIRTKNGCRLGVKSYGGSFRGRHPGYLVLDDYLRENVIYSATQRKKSNNYFFATLMNAVLKQGQTVVVGTPMHEQDIYGILKGNSEWVVFEYPAIFPDGTILWPGRYTFEDLMKILDEQGTLLFARERLVRPIMSETSIFPYKFIKRAYEGMEGYTLVKNDTSFPRNFIYKVVGVDLAISGAAGADYSVFTVFGIDERFDMWLLYIWRGKGKSYGQQLEILRAINTNFRPDLFSIESNQFQAVVGEGAEEFGLPVYLHNTGENKYHFKYGLPALSVMFERRKIHIPRGDEYSKGVSDIIANEFMAITWTDKGLEGVGAHDDIPMSVWKAYAGVKHIDNVNFGVI